MFEIQKRNLDHSFYIGTEFTVYDIDTAKYLNLSLNEYQFILISNGAFIEDGVSVFGNKRECFFKNKKDVEKAIEALEPYLIMAKLTGD